jgi:hypothetical protein
MDDEVYKSPDGLLAEIAELRRRIAELNTLQEDEQQEARSRTHATGSSTS